MLSTKSEDAPGAETKAPRAAAQSLRIGEPNDVFEQEANRVANEIAPGSHNKLNWALSKMNIGTTLRRKCGCGGSAGAEGQCPDCEKKETVQRRAAGTATPTTVPPIVHEVLRSPGQPLDVATRAFFEPRFGHDFSQVRVHTDARSAESARAVNASAYTVEQDIAFGDGQYAPHTAEGRRLLAHELTHTLQWGAQLRRQVIPVPGTPGLAGPYSGYQPFPSPPPAPTTQPCLKSVDCSKPIPGSSWDFSHQVATQQAQTAKDIAASPEKAKAAGSARPAVNLKAFADKIDPALLSGIDQVVVNPAIGDSAGAQATNCKGAAPETTGPSCIEAPDQLEREADKFNHTKDAQIDGATRADWKTETLGTLTHEVAHTKFAKARPTGITSNVQSIPNYSPDIFWYELGEMNSVLSEYPIHYKSLTASSGAPTKDQQDAVRLWIADAIGNGQEDLRGMIKKLKCISPCHEVNKAVRKVFASQSAGWTQPAKDLFIGEVSDPGKGVGWPK